MNSASPEFVPGIILCLIPTTSVIVPKVSRQTLSYLWFTTMCYQHTIRLVKRELDDQEFKPEMAFCLKFAASIMPLQVFKINGNLIVIYC